jgi:hypothetical protein
MTPAFVPELFAEPVISPETATYFRRTPYISGGEYKQSPTAVSVTGLVPGGSAEEQAAALAAVIMRASGWVDQIVFHQPAGTLAASPSTESGWITPKNNGSLALICNFKPILEVDALALGTGPSNMENIGQQGAESITIQEPIIWLQGLGAGSFGPVTWFPSRPTINGKIYAVWSYVNGFPHSYLAAEAKAGESKLTVGPSNPGGTKMYGVYPGTQLTIHDAANTEVIVVESIEGLTLTLQSPLVYAHKVPVSPETVRVTAIPWVVEQATISLTSALIKMRGARSMVIPQSPGGGGSPPKQAEGQSGGASDERTARKLLAPYSVPYIRST